MSNALYINLMKHFIDLKEELKDLAAVDDSIGVNDRDKDIEVSYNKKTVIVKASIVDEEPTISIADDRNTVNYTLQCVTPGIVWDKGYVTELFASMLFTDVYNLLFD